MDPETALVAIEPFMANYAPFCPSPDVVNACISRISSGRNPVLIKMQGTNGSEDRYRWRDFFDIPSVVNVRRMDKNGTPHKQPPQGEPTVFSSLKKIYAAIAQHIIPGRPRSCDYDQAPSQTTKSELAGATQKVDAFCQLRDKRSKELPREGRHTANLACRSSYKLHDEPADVYDNRLQAVSDAVHTMNNDPIRTHTYSITIEDSRMAMWYWSRSHSVKSEDFTFASKSMAKAEVAQVVAVIMSVLFATQEELGYDPKIQRFRDDKNEIYYVFHLPDEADKKKTRYYRTVGSLFEMPTSSIAGRATRVWKVQETRDARGKAPIRGLEPMALKDVWIDEAAESELTIQRKIFADLEHLAVEYASEPTTDLPRRTAHIDRKKFNQNRPESLVDANEATLERVCQCLEGHKYKEHFMAITADRTDGPVTRRLPEPGEGVLFLGKLFDLPTTRDTSHPIGEASRQATAQSAASGFIASEPTRRRVGRALPRRRRRYFVLYRDVCTSVDSLRSFKTVFTVLKDSLMALRLMALVKWIHRDISGGNVHGHESPPGRWRGILGDLEYALKDTGAQRVVSDEPKTGTPAYMAVEVQNGRTVSGIFGGVMAEGDDWLKNSLKRKGYTASPSTAAVKHIIFHDVESFMWLALRFVADRVDWTDSLKLSAEVFRHHFPAPDRKANLLELNDNMEALNNTLHSAFSPLAHLFEGVARYLCTFYVRGGQHKPDAPLTVLDLLFDEAYAISTGPAVPPMLTGEESENLRVQLAQLQWAPVAQSGPSAAPSGPGRSIRSTSSKRSAPDSDDDGADEEARCASDGRAEKHLSKASRRAASDRASSGRPSLSLHEGDDNADPFAATRMESRPIARRRSAAGGKASTNTKRGRGHKSTSESNSMQK